MGPSASEVPDAYGDDQVAALVKSLSHIQHTLQDPKLRAVISNVAPNLLTAFGPDGGVEYQDALSGKPTSSRPAGTESKQAVIEFQKVMILLLLLPMFLYQVRTW